MDYKKEYDRIINNALERNDLKGYFEEHHLILKSLGGTDEKTNLVKLTAREHYIVHWLLCFLNPCKETIRAFESMRGAGSSRKFERKRVLASERIKGDLNPAKRKEVRDKISKKVSGELNGMFGKTGDLNPAYGMKHDPLFLRKKQLLHSSRVHIKDYNSNKAMFFQCVSDCAEYFNCTSENILFRIKQNKIAKFGKFKNILISY